MPAATWKRLGMESEGHFRLFLRQLYYTEGLSQLLIARRLGIHPETIRLLFKKYHIEVRPQAEALAFRHQRDKVGVRFSPDELEVLDGLLLGDGHLELSSGARSARYRHGCKYTETLAQIREKLPSPHFSDPRRYAGYWFFKTLAYTQLLPIWQRWYGLGAKRVPLDLPLTPTRCYRWFIADGSISKHRYDLQLSTDGFSAGYCQYLRQKFAELDIKASITGAGRLLVSAQDVPKFYALIGPCRNPEYAYKWAYRAPKWTFQRYEAKGKAICPRH